MKRKEGAPLRVAIVTQFFPLRSQSFLNREIIGLLERGVDVHVITFTSPKSEWDAVPGLRERLAGRVHQPRRSFSRPAGLWRALVAAGRTLLSHPRASRRYLRRAYGMFGTRVWWHFLRESDWVGLSPDVLHFAFGWEARERIYLKETLDCAALTSFRGHGANFHNPDDDQLFGEVWRGSDALHLRSEELGEIVRWRGCPDAIPRRVVVSSVVADEVDSGSLPREGMLGTPERPLRIVSIGRLVWSKNHEDTLCALKRLVDEGMHVEARIIGEGEHRTALDFTLRDLALEGVVQLLGARPHAEIKEHLAWADVCVHASVSEGCCNAVLEAQAAGVPVVCSDASGVGDAIVNGETGFVVARRDARALADKLGILARDGALRRRFSDAGRHRARTVFAPGREIDGLLELYELAMSEWQLKRSAVKRKQ